MALALLWFRRKPKDMDEFVEMVTALEYGISIGAVGNVTFDANK